MSRLPKIKYSSIFFLAFVLIFICLYVSFFVKQNVHYITSSMPNFQNSTKLLIAKAKFEGCYKEAAKVYYSDSNKFFAEFSQCIKTYIPITELHMDKILNGSGDERKVFLPLAEDFPEEECTWLTIGIGGSKTAEEKFHKIYPKCKIFGADAGNAGKFADVGTLISNGVGIEDGEIELSVMENKKYTIVKKKVTSLTNLLDNYLHSRTLHYLTIDIEGYEHIILSELVGSGKFAKDGLKICQIDAELHNPKYIMVHPLVKNLNQVQFILNFLNGTSPYIPIYNIPFTYNPHQKVTFINVLDSECEKAFKFSSYFQ